MASWGLALVADDLTSRMNTIDTARPGGRGQGLLTVVAAVLDPVKLVAGLELDVLGGGFGTSELGENGKGEEYNRGEHYGGECKGVVLATEKKVPFRRGCRPIYTQLPVVWPRSILHLQFLFAPLLSSLGRRRRH